MGELDHNRIQKRLLYLFILKETEWQVECIQEQRLQVSSDKYRVSDIMVLAGLRHTDQIVRTAPLLIAEILSPEDTFKRLYEKVEDYLSMGVEDIWTFEPSARLVYRCDVEGFHILPEEELTVAGTPITLKRSDIFSCLDR